MLRPFPLRLPRALSSSPLYALPFTLKGRLSRGRERLPVGVKVGRMIVGEALRCLAV